MIWYNYNMRYENKNLNLKNQTGEKMLDLSYVNTKMLTVELNSQKVLKSVIEFELDKIDSMIKLVDNNFVRDIQINNNNVYKIGV